VNRLAADTQLFCTFRVDGQLFGVDILDVKEVTTETTSTRIAHTPEEVLGLVNIRGHIYLALDLRRLLGLREAQRATDSRLVLFKSVVGAAFGVIVDEISEIHSVATTQIEAYSSTDHESLVSQLRPVDLIAAVCKLPEELLVVLNPRRFLGIVEQYLNNVREKT
jgi:purine-binding chemotaxis protein CheW